MKSSKNIVTLRDANLEHSCVLTAINIYITFFTNIALFHSTIFPLIQQNSESLDPIDTFLSDSMCQLLHHCYWIASISYSLDNTLASPRGGSSKHSFKRKYMRQLIILIIIIHYYREKPSPIHITFIISKIIHDHVK